MRGAQIGELKMRCRCSLRITWLSSQVSAEWVLSFILYVTAFSFVNKHHIAQSVGIALWVFELWAPLKSLIFDA